MSTSAALEWLHDHGHVLSRQRVNKLINEGRIQAIRSGGTWIVTEDALRQFIATPRKPGKRSKKRADS